MSLFGLGKKKEEVKIEPACACNGEVATYEASSCCCGGQQIENCCGGDNKVITFSISVIYSTSISNPSSSMAFLTFSY